MATSSCSSRLVATRKAGALVVRTVRGEDIWIRFAPPHMCYCADDEEELLTIVDALVDERVMFARIAGPQDEWTGTTLIAQCARVDLQTGEMATVRSWSGRFDQEFVANTPGASWLEFHDSVLLAVDAIDSGVELRLDRIEAVTCSAPTVSGERRELHGSVSPITRS